MTPREIVSELDRYIVGQHDAKRAVAIALRNRWRRQNVAPELRDEIAPKNILMIGPDRRRQDRNRAPPGPSGAGAVRQGRGLALHRSRLRRARRRIDDPRPGRNRGQDGARGRTRAGRDPGPRGRRRAPARHPLSAARPRSRRPVGITPEGAIAGRGFARATRARSCASCCATAIWTIARSKSKSAHSPRRWSRCFTPQGMEEMGVEHARTC